MIKMGNSSGEAIGKGGKRNNGRSDKKGYAETGQSVWYAHRGVTSSLLSLFGFLSFPLSSCSSLYC